MLGPYRVRVCLVALHGPPEPSSEEGPQDALVCSRVRLQHATVAPGSEYTSHYPVRAPSAKTPMRTR
ncbi:hypothetical protein TREES_T100000062 [Tupaia chinensis]|uniref:Uncharacterized protein n=1 Tax=Tupaia chinensis TaxID=246437 RepID=L9LEC0_TUPCH|nr:hypothetical protein TREES_T100000062 [Tupaia chinensis]